MKLRLESRLLLGQSFFAAGGDDCVQDHQFIKFLLALSETILGSDGLGVRISLLFSECWGLGVALHSEYLMQLGIEDCHVRETVFRKIGKAFMNQSGQGDRHL